jgi:aldose sugar dehydrogenase
MIDLRHAFLNVAVSTVLAGCPGSSDEPPAFEVSGPAPRAAPDGLQVTTVVEGLEHPWGLAFLPGDEGILVTERSGRLRLVRGGRLEPDEIGGLPEIRVQGEGGLLGVALHPHFAENRLVYLAYSKPGPRGGTTAVMRGRLQGDGLVGVGDVLVADAWSVNAVNYGGRLAFGRDGHLFVTVGDRREMERAQDLRDHVGTTLRVYDDGRVPADNPFVGRAGARDEIYTYGHRNSQGMAVHPATGEIWQLDHGARGGDEINRIMAGRNYGWPEVSFGDHYDGRRIPDPRQGDGTEPPLHHWTPGVSPSGFTIYTGGAFPDWHGDFFSGSLVARELIRVRTDGTEVVEEDRLLTELGHRIRDVVTGPDGFLYLLIDSPRAPLLRVGR